MPHLVKDGAEDRRRSLSRKTLRLTLPIPEGFDQLRFHAVPSTLPVVHIDFLLTAFEEFIEPGIDALHILDAIAARARLWIGLLHFCWFRPLGHSLRGFCLPDAVPAGKALCGFLRSTSFHQGDEVDDVTTLLPAIILIAGLGEAAPVIPFEVD